MSIWTNKSISRKLRLRKGFSITLCLLVFLSCTIINPVPAHAATNYYVSAAAGSSDSNDGSQAHPFRTIKRASEAASAGDTIHVAAGTYDGGFTTSASGTSSAYITYVSDSRGDAIIVPPQNCTSEFGWNETGDYVIIDGFEVDGSVYRSGAFWTVGINLYASHTVVKNCDVHHILTNETQCANNGNHGGAGIMLEGYDGDAYMTATANTVHHIGPSNRSASGAQYVQGIYASSGYDTITNNLVYLVSCDGISNYHDATRNIIHSNTIFNCKEGIDVASGGTYYLSETPDYFYVANNIVYNCQNGIEEYGSSMGYNNTFTNNLTNNNTSYNYNLVHATAQNPVTSAPQFVSYAADGSGNYHLSASPTLSPAINAGTATNAPSVDYDGASRPAGTGYDIGAFEYGGTTGSSGWYSKASWPSGVQSVGTGNSGSIYAEFDLTPQAINQNVTVGYAASGVTVDGYAKMAMIIAMDPTQGYFTVRNGGSYAKDATVTYSANTVYHFKIVPNFTNHTYTVYVTPNGGSQSTLAANYGFRSDVPASNDMAQISLKSDNDNAVKIENHKIYSNPTQTAWYSKASWSSGVQSLGSGNSGNIYTEFDLTPSAINQNMTVGYAASGVTVDGYTKMAMIIAMDPAQGYFTVRNGGAYAKDTTVTYSAGTVYHFKVVPNFTNHTYTVYVTPNGGSQAVLASNYAFRSDAPTTNDIGQMSLKSDNDNTVNVNHHFYCKSYQ